MHAQACARGLSLIGTYCTSRPSLPGQWLSYRFPQVAPSSVFGGLALSHVLIIARLADPTAAAHCKREAFAAALIDLLKAVSARGACGRPPRLVYVSSDTVFSGERGLLTESAPPNPTTVYGDRQRLAEAVVQQHTPDHLVVRPSLIFGRSTGQLDKRWSRLERDIRAGKQVAADSNVFRSPADVEAVSRLILQAALSDLTGLLHVGGARISILDFYRQGLHALGLTEHEPLLIERRAERDHDTSLASERTAECKRKGIANAEYQEGVDPETHTGPAAVVGSGQS